MGRFKRTKYSNYDSGGIGVFIVFIFKMMDLLDYGDNDDDDTDDEDNADDENPRKKSSHLKQLGVDLHPSGHWQSKESTAPVEKFLNMIQDQDELEKLHLERYMMRILPSVKGESSKLKEEATDLSYGGDLRNVAGQEGLLTMNGRKRGSSELERLLMMPESSGGGNKRCARCFKRWSLDSGGWGKRGSQGRSWGKRVKSGGERNWYNILRARANAELIGEKQLEDSMHAVLLWGRVRGLILGKRMSNNARENQISRIDIREATALRRRRALPPLDESRASGQIERSELGKTGRDDLVFVVPLTSTGWNLDYWGRLRRKHLLSERIQQISVSRPTLVIGNYW